MQMEMEALRFFFGWEFFVHDLSLHHSDRALCFFSGMKAQNSESHLEQRKEAQPEKLLKVILPKPIINYVCSVFHDFSH